MYDLASRHSNQVPVLERSNFRQALAGTPRDSLTAPSPNGRKVLALPQFHSVMASRILTIFVFLIGTNIGVLGNDTESGQKLRFQAVDSLVQDLQVVSRSIHQPHSPPTDSSEA